MVNRNRNRANTTVSGNNKTPKQMLPAVPMNQQQARRPRRPRRRPRAAMRRMRVGRPAFNNLHGLTKAGVNFLKCAYASPDFAVDPGMGIPDNYDNLALMRKDVFTNTATFLPNLDTWILMMPTPGVAYWQTTTAVGAFPTQASVWTPTYNASFATLFGAPTDQTASVPNNPVERSFNVTKFRYASNALEITPTSNFTQFAGSITVWKLPITIEDGSNVTGTGATQATNIAKILVGVDGVTRVAPDNKPFKFLDGAFSMAVNTESEWPFESILSGVTRIPGVGLTATTNATWGQFQGDILGVGHLQSVVMRVSTPTGAINSAIIKTWSCLEYQPNPGSAFYEFAGTSPQKDEVALRLYRDIALKIPVAVCVAENDGFWRDRVLPVMRGFMRAARVVGAAVPQVGAAVAGVDALSELFASM
jgi:hypothetical protein